VHTPAATRLVLRVRSRVAAAACGGIPSGERQQLEDSRYPAWSPQGHRRGWSRPGGMNSGSSLLGPQLFASRSTADSTGVPTESDRALLPGPVVESEALVLVSPPAPVALYTTTGNKRCIISKRSSTLRPGRKVVSFPAAALQHSAAWSKVVSFPAAALYSAMMPLEAQQCVRAAAQAVSPWRLYRPASGCAAPALLLRAESC
jgi:hypothetical protein